MLPGHTPECSPRSPGAGYCGYQLLGQQPAAMPLPAEGVQNSIPPSSLDSPFRALVKHRSAQRPLLYLLVWIGDCGLSLFIFTVTRHLAEQDGNFISLGIFGSCLSLPVALCAALFGHFADRLDRAAGKRLG